MQPLSSVVLDLAPDEQAVLRQTEPGLPRKIIVQFASSAGEGSGGGFGAWTGGGGTYEYELE